MNMKKAFGIVFASMLAAFVGATCALTSSRPAHGASGDPGYPTAGTVAIGYGIDKTLGAFRSGIGVADSTVIATITSTSPASGTAAMAEFGVSGKPNICLDAVFTGGAAQTCVVRVLWIYRDAGGTLRNTRWSNPVTLSATALPGPGDVGNATGPGFVFDTGGATNCRFVVTTTAASGTLSLYPTSF